MKPKTRPRLIVDITEDQRALLSRYLSWGITAPLFRVIIDDLICILEDDKTREKIIGMIMSGNIKTVDWSRIGGNNK